MNAARARLEAMAEVTQLEADKRELAQALGGLLAALEEGRAWNGDPRWRTAMSVAAKHRVPA